MRLIWLVLRQAASRWRRHHATTHGAALAFFAMLSLAPLMVILVRLIGIFFGEEAAQGSLVERLEALTGDKAAQSIQALVEASGRTGRSATATWFGIGVSMVGATAVFAQVQESLNAIWGVRKKRGRGVVDFLRRRGLSFAMLLGLGGVLLASLLASAWFAAMQSVLARFFPHAEVLGPWEDLGLSFIVLTAVFALIFKILPDARIAWPEVWVGSAVTALLFLAGRHGIGFYLGHAAVASMSGAAGSFMALLLWVYYSALIFYFGAEVTHAWAAVARGRRRHGSPLEAGSEKAALPFGRNAEGRGSVGDINKRRR